MSESKNAISRRRFIQGVGATAGLFAAPALLKGVRGDAWTEGSGLFSLGVASGDPSARSVVLWTRLAPDPLNGGGLRRGPVRVDYEIATDGGMANLIRKGSVVAHPKNGFSVHVVAAGLPSNCALYYRFHALGESSRLGRTRTFPGPQDVADRLRFAVANCQNYQEGFYTAYRDMLGQEGIDFVLHLGDYIYENGPTNHPIAPGRVHNSPEIVSVEDYRNRYALYRLDPDLQEAHARFPFIVTWDDHEVDNNYAGLIPEASSPTQGEEFVERRRNAYQVYAETMPLRPANRAGNGSGLRLARRLAFGDLVELHVLDTRQYRTDQPAADGFGSTDPDSIPLEPVFEEQLFDADGILDPSRSLLGDGQEAWLARNLRRSRATWNLLAQQVMVTEWNLVEAGRLTIELDPSIPDPVKTQILQQMDQVENMYNVDAWDGYQTDRRRLLDLVARSGASNPIVLTGDIHSAWGANLVQDFADPDSQMVAAEFVCSSISSTFSGLDPRPTHFVVRQSVLADNPHIEYFNGLYRGYCLCDVDRTRWQTTYRAVGTLADVANPAEFALVPFPETMVETDRVLEIAAGFNEPGRNDRIETTFERPIPI